LFAAMPHAQDGPFVPIQSWLEAPTGLISANVPLTVTMAGGQVATFRLPVESQTVKGMPYSAQVVSENIQTLADGNRIVQKRTGRIYRDGEGRIRREDDRPSGFAAITITDPATRISYQLNTETKVALQTVALGIARGGGRGEPGGEFAQRVAEARKAVDAAATGDRVAEIKKVERLADLANADAKKVEQLVEAAKVAAARGQLTAAANDRAGRGRVNEQSVEEKLQDRAFGQVFASGSRRTTTIAAGAIGNEQPIKIVSEEWYAPDLQLLVMTDRNDPRSGRSTYQLLNVERGEPDPSLFQVPADYTIRGIGGGGRRGQQ
jgi:hypothetical protein